MEGVATTRIVVVGMTADMAEEVSSARAEGIMVGVAVVIMAVVVEAVADFDARLHLISGSSPGSGAESSISAPTDWRGSRHGL